MLELRGRTLRCTKFEIGKWKIENWKLAKRSFTRRLVPFDCAQGKQDNHARRMEERSFPRRLVQDDYPHRIVA